MHSLTIENYVKAIYQIATRQEKTSVSTGDLSQSLDVSPGTVTSMMKTLEEAKLVCYTKYEGVSLTESGKLLALRVLRRHRLIELFLVQTLGLSWAEVHEEAENMEHAVSDLLIDRIDQFLGHPEADPHGDPIPQADGTINKQDYIKLTHLESNATFRLARVLDQSSNFLEYLSQQNLSPGSEGKILQVLPEAGIVTIEVDQQQTTLGFDAAEKILVTHVNAGP